MSKQDTPISAEQKAFEEWFVDNYPPDCVISRPEWHAPKIYRAATRSLALRLAAAERFTYDLCEAVYGSFLRSNGRGTHICVLCESQVDVQQWMTATHADHCIVNRARDYLNALSSAKERA